MKTTIFVLLLLAASSLAFPRAAIITYETYDAGCICLTYKAFIISVANGDGKVNPAFFKNVARLQSLCKDAKSFSGIIYLDQKYDPLVQAREFATAVKTAKLPLTYVASWGPNWKLDDVETNRKFFKDFMGEYLRYGISTVILAQGGEWNRLMGPTYTAFNMMPLMYVDLDNNPNKNTFRPFGGWTADQVVAKRYVDPYACGMLTSDVALYS